MDIEKIDINFPISHWNIFVDWDAYFGNYFSIAGNRINKINNLGLDSVDFLQNNSFNIDGYDICGTRGWIPRDHKDFTDHDEKIFTRELMRLGNSLRESGDNKKIIMLHYPPINQDKTFNEFYDICLDNNVEYLIYGHLHGIGHNLIKEGKFEGIDIKCVAGDYINFTPVRIVYILSSPV